MLRNTVVTAATLLLPVANAGCTK